MRDDLKERLRAMVTNRPDSLGICTSWHRNPDGPEAADRIATLEAKLAEKDAQLAEARAENERLRGALRVYAGPMEWTQEGGWGAFPVWADGYPGGVYVDDNTLDYGDAARAALAKIKDATDAD